jgi:hypothetical protein
VLPPPAPQAPPVDQSAWEKSVEQAKVQDETVHDVGLRNQILFRSTGLNDPLDAAREKMAWVILSGYHKWGADRPKHASTASPIEPSPQELSDPAILAAYQSSLKGGA